MVRTCIPAILLSLALSSGAYGQASAGCGEVGVCGTPRGNSGPRTTGSGAAPANSQSARAAAAMRSLQETQQTNQQILQDGANALINVLTPNSGSTDNTDPSVPDNSGGPADSSNGAYIPPEPAYTWTPTPQPSTASAVSALLDSGQPSNSTADAVSALLGDTAQPASAQPSPAAATAATSAVASLLDSSKVSDSGSAFAGYASLPAPPDPQFSAAMQDSTDQPDPSRATTLPQLPQSAGSAAQDVKDELTGLVASTKSLISSYADSPEVYWLVNQGWKGTTAPLPAPGSTQEMATDLTFGQATVGLGDILEGMATSDYSKLAQATGASTLLEGAGVGPAGAGVAQGIYNYGAKMVNQMGAFLGLATNSIFKTGADQQQ